VVVDDDDDDDDDDTIPFVFTNVPSQQSDDQLQFSTQYKHK
jgi:hypothetical protein